MRDAWAELGQQDFFVHAANIPLKQQQQRLAEIRDLAQPWLPDHLPMAPKTLPRLLRRRFRLWMGLPGNQWPAGGSPRAVLSMLAAL